MIVSDDGTYDSETEDSKEDQILIDSSDSSFSLVEESESESYESLETENNNLKLNWVEMTNIPNEIHNGSGNFSNLNNMGFQRNLNIDDLITPIDYFNIIFSSDLIKTILRYSNINGNRKYDNNILKKNKMRQWKEIDEIEIECFIGLIIYMGYVKKPSIYDYFEKSKISGTPGINRLLPRERFLQIYRTLIFRDIDKNDKSFNAKFQLLKDAIITNSQLYYLPQRELSLDESLIDFKGRHKNRVYMPNKAHKYGFKAYMLTESSSSYILNWSIYSGVKQSIRDIVLPLCLNLEGEGYTIFFDNFYSSPKLFIELKKHGIDAVGTVREDRLQIGNNMKTKIYTLNTNDYIFYNDSESSLFSCFWKDKKPVKILSTLADLTVITKEKIVKKNQEISNITYKIPKLISLYRKNMGGVDRFDSGSSHYFFEHKSNRWYIRIFMHFLEIALRNSYILYSKDTNSNINFINFRKSVARALVKKMRERKRISKTKGKITLFTSSNMNPQFCKLAKRTQKRYCKLHSERKEKIQSRFYCETCDITVCLIPCYDDHRIK